MSGHGVVGYLQFARDTSGRHSLRTAPNQKPERFQPALLSEGSQRFDGVNYVHMSRLIDIWNAVKPKARNVYRVLEVADRQRRSRPVRETPDDM